MIKIGIVDDFPIYIDKSVLFMKHSDKELIIGKFFVRLSKKAQATLIDRNIVEIMKDNRSKIRLNSVYVEALKEMYNIIKNENKDEYSEDLINISNEYIALKRTLSNTIAIR